MNRNSGGICKFLVKNMLLLLFTYENCVKLLSAITAQNTQAYLFQLNQTFLIFLSTKNIYVMLNEKPL